MNLIIKNKIKKLPQDPGVYVFYGADRKILYVGKATNLKSRVGSYFKADANLRKDANLRNITNRPIEVMIHEVADIKTIETDSVLEALILESNLIKKYQPKYNVKEKDDKSFSYFVITKEEWPKVVILRKTDFDSVHSSQSTVHRRKNKNLRTVNCELITQRIYGPYTSKKQMEIALKIMRKIFPFHSSKQKTEKGCLDFQIGLCSGPYAGAISKEDYRKNIRGIRMILEGKKKNLIKSLEKEMQELAKKHEFEKAGETRNKIFALEHIQDVALMTGDSQIASRGSWIENKNDTRDTLRDMRIEAYDISNISGQYAVGSMVVFKNGEPDKSQYRKFKIKTLNQPVQGVVIQGADDVGMMREVLLRRFNNNWPMPDLILLDGGAGHLNMGVAVLESLGLRIPMGAVAKGIDRKKFTVHSSQFTDENIVDILNNKNLIKQIMDEAHRFAIEYHRKLRKKELLV